MPFKLLAFELPLGLDTLAVAIALGMRRFRPWQAAAVFALFEGIMPIFGMIAARFVGLRFELAATIVGGLILIAVGAHAIRESLEAGDETAGLSFDSVRGALLAGVAVSTDELAIGFPLGASHLPVATVLITIAVQAFIVTVGGILVGARIGSVLGARAARYAGIAFALVGLWLIAERLLTGGSK